MLSQSGRKKGKPEGRTFIIEVKDCQNQTWQGSVSWVEGKEKQPFRSALELMKLMDSVIGDTEE